MYADIDRMNQVFSAGVSASAKIIFFALVYHAKKETREAFPSWETLSRETGLSRATVNRALRQLVAAKLVSKRDRGGGRGCIYRISECGKVARGSQAGPNGLMKIPKGSQNDTIGVSKRDLDGIILIPEGSQNETLGVSKLDPNKSIEQKQLTSASTSSCGEEEYMFEEFWNGYPAECPHKVDKAKCRDLYRKLLSEEHDPTAFHGAVMASLGVWRQSRMWRQEGGRFIRSPYNWLAKRSWEDTPDLKKAEEGSSVQLDWTLCVERCQHCEGNGCAKGVKVPPAQNKSRPFPPEECSHFSRLVA